MGGAPSRREVMAKARLSRRPSRLGTPAGAAAKPDYIFEDDAGFPGFLARTWRQAKAVTLPAAVNVLLTLGGHVSADIQLRALRAAEEAALVALFGVTWRQERRRGRFDGVGERAAFIGEIGLTTSGRLAVRVPSQPHLASVVELVDGVRRVPWPPQALAAYRDELRRVTTRAERAVTDCRGWLDAMGVAARDDLLEQLKDAALRTAPFVLYQDDRQYTNFRDRNTLTGKTLWPGHPDCALSALEGIPLELWSDSDVVAVVCLALLVRSAGYARIEEVNGTQLTIDHVMDLLERTRRRYERVPGGLRVPPAATGQVAALNELAQALGERRRELTREVQLYREIYGPLLHKIERIAGPPSQGARQRENMLCAHLRDRLGVTGDSLRGLGAAIAAAPDWLAHPHGDFGTGLESVVYETVRAATAAFDADFGMSRGTRSLPRLVRALRAGDLSAIVGWELPAFFCCVIPGPGAARHFGGSTARLADVAWAISARMQYNSWHFIPGNLPKTPEVVARDYFVPPTIPDLAYHSDQHHHGHVAAKVRFSIRSPQAVDVLGRTFSGFIDLRLLRCEGSPFDVQDLIAAQHASAFIATVTTAAAGLVAGGAELEVTSFDSQWHWATVGATSGAGRRIAEP